MKYFCILIGMVMLQHHGRAQSFKIYKGAAFFTASMPGMARKDENGKLIKPQPVMNRCIYVETNYKGKLKIDSVLYNNSFFTTTAEEIKEAYQVGEKVENRQPVSLIPKKTNRLWKLTLKEGKGVYVKHVDVKKITVKGKMGNTNFTYVITSETELYLPESN
jgi:hypothetical protein